MIDELQEAVAERLRAVALIAEAPAVTVLAENQGDVETELLKGLQRVGLGVVVMVQSMPLETLGKQLKGTAKLNIVIRENVTLNRARAGYRTASKVAESVVGALFGHTPAGGWSPMRCSGLSLTTVEVTEDTRHTLTTWVVECSCQTVLKATAA